MSEERDEQLDAGDELAGRLVFADQLGVASVAEYAQLIEAGFELCPEGYWRLELAGGFEVALEPKVFGGHFLAVYRGQELVHARKLELQLTPREDQRG